MFVSDIAEISVIMANYNGEKFLKEAIDSMSSSGIARGAIMNKHGQSIEVREYRLKNWNLGYIPHSAGL